MGVTLIAITTEHHDEICRQDDNENMRADDGVYCE